MLKKIIIIMLLNSAVFAQSLSSMTGYYNIPSAEVAADKVVTFGAFFVNSSYYPRLNIPQNSIIYFGSISFLPFFEFSFRFTKNIAPPKPEALGDRMVSIKLKLINEDEVIPSISFGAHDFVHTMEGLSDHFNALYLVSTKNFHLESFLDNISVTYGYGVDWISSRNNQYVGHFGGVELRFLQNYCFISEYDGDNVNGAVKLKFFKHINLLLGYIGFKYFCGGASVNFSL